MFSCSFIVLLIFFSFIIIIFYSLRFFHISLSWRVFTRVSETAKYPQISWNQLSIRAILSNVVVWMVSSRPLISKSSSPFNNPLVTVPKATIAIGIIVTIIFHIFFSISLQAPGIYPSFHILSVLFFRHSEQQYRQFCKSSFFVDYYKVRSSVRD